MPKIAGENEGDCYRAKFAGPSPQSYFSREKNKCFYTIIMMKQVNLAVFLTFPSLILAESCDGKRSENVEKIFSWWDTAASTDETLRRVLAMCAADVVDDVGEGGVIEPVSVVIPCTQDGAKTFRLSGIHEDRLEGVGQLQITGQPGKSDQHCVRSSFMHGQPLESLDGSFENGRVNGYGKATYASGIILHGFFKSGVAAALMLRDSNGRIHLMAKGTRVWKVLGRGEGTVLLVTATDAKTASSLADLSSVALAREGQAYTGRFYPKEGYFYDASPMTDESALVEALEGCPLSMPIPQDVQFTGLSLSLVDGALNTVQASNCHGVAEISALNATFFSLTRDPLAQVAPLKGAPGSLGSSALFSDLR
jgi:hypothetical protein